MTKLYESKNYILIYTDHISPKKHSHMAAHIIISTHDDISVMSNGKTLTCRGIMIPSGQPHTVYTYGNPVLVFLYDCTTNTAKQIKKIQCMAENCCEKISGQYALFEQENSVNRFLELEKHFLPQLGITETTRLITDKRVLQAMLLIRSVLPETPSCQSIADTVHLSQGRFSHLFKQQTGMTFSCYIIYQRVMYAYAEILKGKSITEAALTAGFSSSSHFADVNRRIFGISASSTTCNIIFTKMQ